MGAKAVALQFNTHYTIIPLEMLGKTTADGNSAFAPGGKRMRGTQILTAALIHKVRDTFGSLIKMRYSTFTDELGICRATVSRALKELEQDKLINKNGQSDYTMNDELQFGDKKSDLILYSFLLKEKLELNSKVAKKLTTNAALLLSNIISVYLKKKKNAYGRDKYFIGGVQRAAAFLNVAPSTANDAIHELIDVGAIYENRYIEDMYGNVTIENGFGLNGNIPTVYLVNGKLLKRCRQVLKTVEKARKAKAEALDVTRQDEKEKAKEEKKEKKAKTKKAATAPKRSLIEEWRPTVEKLQETHYLESIDTDANIDTG